MLIINIISSSANAIEAPFVQLVYYYLLLSLSFFINDNINNYININYCCRISPTKNVNNI